MKLESCMPMASRHVVFDSQDEVLFDLIMFLFLEWFPSFSLSSFSLFIPLSLFPSLWFWLILCVLDHHDVFVWFQLKKSVSIPAFLAININAATWMHKGNVYRGVSLSCVACIAGAKALYSSYICLHSHGCIMLSETL